MLIINMGDNKALDSKDQLRIHNLHQNMQEWAKHLPLRIQQRMSCELLANLAGCLVSDTTVFEIVNSLIDIQHIVEKEMHRNRIKLKNEYSSEILALTAQGLSQEDFEARKRLIHEGHKEVLRKYDEQTIYTLDEKVKEQQLTLERAGVPGFGLTTDPLEIQMQMCLLDFIIRSGKIIYKL